MRFYYLMQRILVQVPDIFTLYWAIVRSDEKESCFSNVDDDFI